MNEERIQLCGRMFNLPSYRELVEPAMDYTARLGFESFITDVVTNFKDTSARIRPLIITGDVGSGKTVLSCGIMPVIINHFSITVNIYGSLKSLVNDKSLWRRRPAFTVVEDIQQTDFINYFDKATNKCKALVTVMPYEIKDYWLVDFSVMPIVIEMSFNHREAVPSNLTSKLSAFATDLASLK